MEYFPIFLDLKGEPALLVGAGEVAARKLALLERAGARLTVVAPEVLPAIRARAQQGRLELRERPFEPADLEGMHIVIVATGQRALNGWIARLCRAARIPVNVVDDREASSFIVPALVDRDPVLLAISTAGTSPVLARRLRERLEALLPRRLGSLARWLEELRARSRRGGRGTAERRRFFEALIDGVAASRWLAGDEQGARRAARELAETGALRRRGEVTLVGAGPGAAELMTLRGLRALQDADVIFHDRLVSPEVLELARRDARRVAVGKHPGGGGSAQQDINAQLIEEARRGRRVVRLKGGDPFVFGRGGEELEALSAAGIPFSVVPGITAASGCAAYAGIPLTHRALAHGVTFVTAHAEADGALDWRALARPAHTVVFYMGLARLEAIVARLLEHGADPARPAAIVSRGTTPEQRVLGAPLSGIAARAAGAQLAAPAILVVGEVAALHDSLAWFGLEAADVALTRSA